MGCKASWVNCTFRSVSIHLFAYPSLYYHQELVELLDTSGEVGLIVEATAKLCHLPASLLEQSLQLSFADADKAREWQYYGV